MQSLKKQMIWSWALIATLATPVLAQQAPASAANTSTPANPFYTSDVICATGEFFTTVGFGFVISGALTDKSKSRLNRAQAEADNTRRIQENFRKNVVEYKAIEDRLKDLVGQKKGVMAEARRSAGDNLQQRLQEINNEFDPEINNLGAQLQSGADLYSTSMAEAIKADSSMIARIPSMLDLERASNGASRNLQKVVASIRRARGNIKGGLLVMIVGQAIVVFDDTIAQTFNALLPSLSDLNLRSTLADIVAQNLRVGTKAIRKTTDFSKSSGFLGTLGDVRYCGTGN
jgi:hypothetical protein